MSYLQHFGLGVPPFRLTPDPEFIYWSKQHARAKAYMESTIWLADGFVVITGEIGSGKTTLLQSFLSELDDDVVYAVVSQTQLTATQFLQAVLTEFGFKPFNKRKVELLDMLNMYLIEQYADNKKVVLIVDEAQNLSHKVLEEIRLMSGIETHKEKVLRIILCGQPELRETIESPRLEQLMQRVRLRFHLGSLDRREMREYIGHRLKVAGRGSSDLFAPETYDTIHRYTGGVPRLINTLCDTALLCAFADEKHVVDANDLDAAIAELKWQEHETTTGRHHHLLDQHADRTASDAVTAIEIFSDGELVSKHSFPLGRVIVGRSPDNEVFVDSKYVSRHHAQLVSDDSGCVVEDLNSTNGIFLHEKQVKKYRLRDGDRLSIGVHELVYHDLRLRQDKPVLDDGAETDEFDERAFEGQGADDAAVNEQ